MKIFRVLVLCLMALGIPLQGFATASQAFCRMSHAAMADRTTWAPVPDHAAHMDSLHASDPSMHAMHSGMDHRWRLDLAAGQADAELGADAQTLSDAMHQCGHCAQCAAAHAMASWPSWVTGWPKPQPVWVGAVPKLHGRTLTYAPERPPRALTA